MNDEEVYVRAALRPRTVQTSSSDHGHSHGADHRHSETCGHDRVRHGDHFDFIIDGALHHFDEDSKTCAVHGELDFSSFPSRAPTPALVEDWPGEEGEEDDTLTPLRRRNARFMRVARQLATTPRDKPEASWGGASSPPPWYRDRDALRFGGMLALTGSYLVVELVVGVAISSLALQADAFHMLSDVFALLIGFYALRASRRAHSSTASFGYARMEVVGSLVNAVFLLATCLQIVIEAVQRLLSAVGVGADEHEAGGVTDTGLLMVVGGIGLVINLTGIALFATGHGHGHSHGGAPLSTPPLTAAVTIPVASPGPLPAPSPAHAHSPVGAACTGEGEGHAGHGHTHGSPPPLPAAVSAPPTVPTPTPPHHGHSHMDMNMHGVLLHVIGDALGSVAVLLSGAVMRYTSLPYKGLADPLASLIIVFIIVGGTVPLLRASLHILLEKVPSHVDLSSLRKEVLSLPGVLSLHDLHVWAVKPGRTVGTLHLVLDRRVGLTSGSTLTLRKVSDAVKGILHRAGVHASTVQPEWVSTEVQERVEAAAATVLAARRVAAGGEVARGGGAAGVEGAGAGASAPRQATAPSSGAAAVVCIPSPGTSEEVSLLALDMCDEVVCGEGCVEASCCPQPHPHHDAVGSPRRAKAGKEGKEGQSFTRRPNASGGGP